MLKKSIPSFLMPSVYYGLLMFLLFLVSSTGIFIPIMEVDATQYANMSLELLRSESLLQFTDLGQDYLDKPPLLFWFSAFSISIFGNTTWAFKLPSFIMAWASVYFLYQLVKIYYNINIAKLSTLLYAGSVAFILFSNDIRTDTLMISFVVLAVWQLAQYMQSLKLKHLFIAALALGLSMLAKGPIGLVVPILAFAPHLFFSGRWKFFLNWRMILVPFIILIVLSPMMLGLYEQFGMHGIRFYFWEQSFGRITGENVWKNDATYFYFLHNIAWAFIPFILFLLGSLINFIIQFKSQKEYISFFGFVLPFIALSMSHYKLPHYIYVCIPFASILAANYLHSWLKSEKSLIDIPLKTIQSIILFALIVLPTALFIAFPAPVYLYLIYAASVIIVVYILYKTTFKKALFYTSLMAFIYACFVLNKHAYPHLLKYQSSSEAAFYIQEQNLPIENLYQLNIWQRAFHYYSNMQVPEFNENKLVENKEIYVFTDQKGFDFLSQKYPYEVIKQFDEFSVTRLSLNFLNPQTRNKTLKNTFIIKIKKTP